MYVKLLYLRYTHKRGAAVSRQPNYVKKCILTRAVILQESFCPRQAAGIQIVERGTYEATGTSEGRLTRRRLLSASRPRCAPPPGSTFQDEFQSRYRPRRRYPAAVPLAGEHKESPTISNDKGNDGETPRRDVTCRLRIFGKRAVAAFSGCRDAKYLAETKTVRSRATKCFLPEGNKHDVTFLLTLPRPLGHT